MGQSYPLGPIELAPAGNEKIRLFSRPRRADDQCAVLDAARTESAGWTSGTGLTPRSTLRAGKDLPVAFGGGLFISRGVTGWANRLRDVPAKASE
jgi:hypothetical protein